MEKNPIQEVIETIIAELKKKYPDELRAVIERQIKPVAVGTLTEEMAKPNRKEPPVEW